MTTPVRTALLKAIETYDHETLLRFALRPYRSPTTRATYGHAIRSWIAFCEHRGYALLTPPPGSDQEWTDTLALAGHSSNTLRQRRPAIGALYRMFRAEGLLFVPFEDVNVGEPVPNPRQPYTQNEKDRLIAAADDPEDLVVVLMHIELGLRRSEILAITWDDISGEHTITVNGQRHTLSARLDNALHATPNRIGRVLSYRSESRLYQRMRDLAKRAGVKNWRGTDCLRPTAA